jgi:hypothetical protein
MHVRVNLTPQATTTGRTTQRTTERPEQPERPEQRERPEQPEQPERPERPASPDVAPAPENQGMRVIIRDGIPGVPPVPVIAGVDVHPGRGEPMIPPQVVDLAYGFYAMLAVRVIGWPLARAWGRRLERGGASAALSPAMGEQLQRIEQAVEAMSLEVERISEAQRYLTKLQAGRATESAALPSGETR